MVAAVVLFVVIGRIRKPTGERDKYNFDADEE